jgi:NAD(P)H-dependent FMN reductase
VRRSAARHAGVQQLDPGRFQERDRLAVASAADIKRVFGGKPVALLGASPGAFGTILSQNAWLPVLRTLGAELWTGQRLLVSRASGVFDAQGALTDAKIADLLRGFVEGFFAYVAARAR